ncbi:MAG TPA: transporter substrate-binding domain-containing protein [Caproiciproducens sp.]|nr:transporter substrate-binding domain-containing protein [Caproiciproducens sp.]
MLKRILFGVIALTLAAAAFTGCGSNTAAEKASASAASAPASTTSAFQSSTANATVVKVGTMGTYSPYSYTDKDGKLTGYDLEVLRKVEKVDPSLKFEFIAGPWDSLFVGLDADKFQMLANQITSNEKRKEKYYLTENSYYTCVDEIIVKAGRTDIKSLEDLKGKTLGLTVGDAHNTVPEKWNKEHGNVIKIHYYQEDITTILQDIQNGRVDATVNDPAVAVSKAKTEGLEVQPAGDRLSESPTFFIFKQDAQGKVLKDKIDAALAELRKNGELSQLSKDWFGADYTR